MNYAQWLQWMVTACQIADASGIAAFTAIAPMIIAYAEGRIYRDPGFDFLATRLTDVSQSTTSGLRSVPLPAGFVVVEGVALVLPANTVPSKPGATRIPYLRTRRDFIDLTWPVESQTATPDAFVGGHYALFSEEEAQPAPAEDEPLPLPSSILLAPTPDNSYRVEITGTQRPAPLSATNQATFLATYLPDLFFAASMVAAAGYQRDYGAQSDDPRMALSWDALYRELRAGVEIEELRKKSEVDGFSSSPPKPSPPADLMARAAQQQ